MLEEGGAGVAKGMGSSLCSDPKYYLRKLK
jgi:hypothetical protein